MPHTHYTEGMTNQIDYQSKRWANDVSKRLDAAYAHTLEAASILRSLAEDLDADGKDMERGPHAPPVEDVRALLRIANSLLVQQAGNWRGYALYR